MNILLHFIDRHGTETRFVLEPVSIELNHEPSKAVVQSFVPPNTPRNSVFEGLVLKKQHLHGTTDWYTSDDWYILPGVKHGKIYNEFGGKIGVNIASPDFILNREKKAWEDWDGESFFKGERVLNEPQKIFVS